MIEDCYMTGIIDKINSLYPISDDTIRTLKESMTLCRFPKKYQLIRAGMYCKSAYFIGKGMTRSFWLVNGEEITTSFSCEGGIVFSMDELYYNKMSEEFVETLEDLWINCVGCSRRISNWLIGGGLSIKTSIGVCIAPIRIV